MLAGSDGSEGSFSHDGDEPGVGQADLGRRR